MMLTARDEQQAVEARWRRDFADEWRDIGRPFFECIYCGTKKEPVYHFTATDRSTGKPTPGVPVCTNEKFVRGVVAQFPMLRRSAGLTPWEPEKFARWWRSSGAQTSGSYHAVAFVLNVWSGSNDDYWKRRGYSFDVSRALCAWDYEHRAAFQRWVASPWWP